MARQTELVGRTWLPCFLALLVSIVFEVAARAGQGIVLRLIDADDADVESFISPPGPGTARWLSGGLIVTVQEISSRSSIPTLSLLPLLSRGVGRYKVLLPTSVLSQHPEPQGNMTRRSMALLPLSLTLMFSSALAQSCKWKNGQDATDYFACDPTAAQSQCCLQGEACVSSGYCYGSLGVIYRGACAGGWGNDTACPQACNDAGMYLSRANIYQLSIDTLSH